MESLAAGFFLAVANQKIIDYLAEPIRKRYPTADLWWLVYLALATGAALAWVAQVNLFGAFIPDPLAGRVISCIAVGGGSSLLHDIFDE